MGCDIHVAIQVLDGDVWTHVQYQVLWPFEVAEGQQPIPGVPLAPVELIARNYDLFGILAGVRSVQWDIVAPRRGWPEDFRAEDVPVDPKYPEEGPRSMGEHSFTWLTLAELKAYDWTATVAYGYMGNDTVYARDTDWPDKVIPWLEQVAAGHELRLVLGFDS